MLSKGGQEKPDHLRRAKSTSSVPRQAGGRQIPTTNTSSSRSNALTAATRAFEKQSGAIEGHSYDTSAHCTYSPALRHKSKSEGSHLARGSILGSKKKLSRSKNQIERIPEDHLNTSPGSQLSTDICYSKTGLVASQFASHGTPAKCRNSGQDCAFPGASGPPYVIHESGSHLLRTPPSLALARKRLLVDSSILDGSGTDTSADIIAFARDKYLSNHRETLLSRSKPFNLGSWAPKLRRSVKYPFSIGGKQVLQVASLLKDSSGQDQPTRTGSGSISSSLKRSLQRAFSSRKQEGYIGLPAQQVQSKELHYGRFRDFESKWDKSGSFDSGNATTMHTDRYMSPRTVSIESNKAFASEEPICQTMSQLQRENHDGGRSRVTSWADSSFQNTISTHNVRPLHIIRESAEPRCLAAKRLRSISSTTSQMNPLVTMLTSRNSKGYDVGGEGMNRIPSSKYHHICERKHSTTESTVSAREDTNQQLPKKGFSMICPVSLEKQFHHGTPEVENNNKLVNERPATSRHEVVSPSIYTNNAMSKSLISLESHYNFDATDHRGTGTAFVLESKSVSRWSLESPARSRKVDLITPSNDWRQWLDNKIADLNSVGESQQQYFSHSLQKQQTLSVHDTQELFGTMQAEDDIEAVTEEVHSEATEKAGHQKLSPEKQLETQESVIKTEPVKDKKFTLRKTSDDSVIVNAQPIALDRWDTIDKKKPEVNGIAKPGSVEKVPFVSGVNRDWRRFPETMQETVAEERPELQCKPSLHTLRDFRDRPRTGLRRKAIMPHSTADEGFLLKIRRGPYASSPSPTSSPTDCTHSRQSQSGVEKVGQENRPPGLNKGDQQRVGVCLANQENAINESQTESHTSSAFL